MSADDQQRGNGWKRDEREIRFRLDEYEERTKKLELAMTRQVIALTDLKARVLTWTAVISIVIGCLASAGTAWALRVAEDKRVVTLLEELLEQNRKAQAERSNR